MPIFTIEPAIVLTSRKASDVGCETKDITATEETNPDLHSNPEGLTLKRSNSSNGSEMIPVPIDSKKLENVMSPLSKASLSIQNRISRPRTGMPRTIRILSDFD
jgi:hypothetical protein